MRIDEFSDLKNAFKDKTETEADEKLGKRF